MKKSYLCLAMVMATMLGFNSLSAQPSQDKREDFRAKQLSKELMLDDATASKFETLYKEYSEALKACRPAREEKKQAPAGRTDEQIKQSIEQRFDMQQKMLDVQKDYFAKFEKILNANQLERLFTPRPPFGGREDKRPHRADKSKRPARAPQQQAAPQNN